MIFPPYVRTDERDQPTDNRGASPTLDRGPLGRSASATAIYVVGSFVMTTWGPPIPESNQSSYTEIPISIPDLSVSHRSLSDINVMDSHLPSKTSCAAGASEVRRGESITE